MIAQTYVNPVFECWYDLVLNDLYLHLRRPHLRLDHLKSHPAHLDQGQNFEPDWIAIPFLDERPWRFLLLQVCVSLPNFRLL